MSAPDTDPQLASDVVRQKEIAIEHGARIGWTLAASFIAGVAVGVGAWFLQRPMDRDDAQFGLALGLSLATFVFGGILCRILFPKPWAKCPQCGLAWDIAGEEPVWLTWNCCPGCGLKMSDETGYHAKP